MRLTRVRLRDFRNYRSADVELGQGVTVVVGPNGAGKTNLLEGIAFGSTGRSPRTSSERELLRHGQSVARVVLETESDAARHTIEVGFTPGEPKRMRVDGRTVETVLAAEERPLVSVFMPERLELVKGGPSVRRGHVDQLVAALWPGRAGVRASYARALAQRNALLARAKAGMGSPTGLDAWDAELARHGALLMADRREALTALQPLFSARAKELGLPGSAELVYRPRSRASDVEELRGELAERRAADLERGFTAHGPHRDDVQMLLDGEALRAYGSQGQQRAALLALLFAEHDLLGERRSRPPLLLLDDVASELDAQRRELLAGLLQSRGQAVVTATDAEQLPGGRDPDVALVEVDGGLARRRRHALGGVAVEGAAA